MGGRRTSLPAEISEVRKGTDLLVQAFERLNATANLVIHSQIPLSQYGRIQHAIARNDKITFIEKTVEPPGLYHLGDVYAYPSRLEGIGLSIVEALPCGLPVITTDAPPMNEFVHHAVNGQLVPVREYLGRADG